MKRFSNILIIAICLISLSITPVFADTTIDGTNFPLKVRIGNSLSAINSSTIDEVEAFLITCDRNFTIKLLTHNHGSINYGNGYTAESTVRLTYDTVYNALNYQYVPISDFYAVKVESTYSDAVVTYDVVTKNTSITGLTRWLSDAFSGIRNALSSLGTFITDTLNSVCDAIIEKIGGVFGWLWDRMIELFQPFIDAIMWLYNLIITVFEETLGKVLILVTNLLKGLGTVTVQPILDLVASFKTGAISVWLDLFELPIIKEFLLGSILVTLIGALLTFFLSI